MSRLGCGRSRPSSAAGDAVPRPSFPSQQPACQSAGRLDRAQSKAHLRGGAACGLQIGDWAPEWAGWRTYRAAGSGNLSAVLRVARPVAPFDLVARRLFDCACPRAGFWLRSIGPRRDADRRCFARGCRSAGRPPCACRPRLVTGDPAPAACADRSVNANLRSGSLCWGWS